MDADAILSVERSSALPRLSHYGHRLACNHWSVDVCVWFVWCVCVYVCGVCVCVCGVCGVCVVCVWCVCGVCVRVCECVVSKLEQHHNPKVITGRTCTDID